MNESSVGYVSTRDGGKLLYGNQGPVVGSTVYTVKLDPFNNMEWSHTYSYPSYSLEVGGIAQTASGNYIALCSIDSICSVWMCKFDSLGNLMVDSLYPNNDPAFCYFARGVASCSVNQVTGVVYYDGPTTDNYDTLFNVDTNLVRLTTTNYCSPAGRAVTTDNSLFPGAIRYNGIVLVYDTNYVFSFGAGDYAEIDSGVLIVGSTNYYTQSFVSQNYLLRVYGMDTLWSRVWGSTSCGLSNIAKLDVNRFYMAGDSTAGGIHYPYLALSDSFGNYFWQQVFSPDITVKSLRVTSSGTVEVFGDSLAGPGNSDYWLVEFDSLGAQVFRGASTGVYQPHFSTLKLYPSPTNGKIFIDLPRQHQAELPYKLLDRFGRVVLEGMLSDDHTVDLSELPVGFYIVRVESQPVRVGKVIRR